MQSIERARRKAVPLGLVVGGDSGLNVSDIGVRICMA